MGNIKRQEIKVKEHIEKLKEEVEEHIERLKEEVEEHIERLKEEAKELEEEIQALEKYNDGKLELNEDNFHKLCNAGLKRSEKLGQELEKVLNIPALSFDTEISACDYEKYILFLRINDKAYPVYIPCLDLRYITISMLTNTEECIQLREEEKDKYTKKVAELNEVINANSLSKCIEYFGVGYKKFFRPVAFFVLYGTKGIFINKLKQIREKLEGNIESCEKEIRDFKLKQEEYERNIEVVRNDIVPELLKWTQKVIIKKSGNTIENEYFER